MKTSVAFVLATAASAAAFAPQSTGRIDTSLNKSLFNIVSDMDLFAPNSKQNFYGARSKKNLKVGKIGDNSYVPSGLTADEYNKIRGAEKSKKDANYAKNVAKAGQFKDYTDFYIKRGTDVNSGWKKSVTLGHDMAKTKYDWSGKENNIKGFVTEAKTEKKKPAFKKFW